MANQPRQKSAETGGAYALDEQIGSLLTEARHRSGKTLQAAAAMLGVHRLTVANYESGASPTPLSSAVRLLRFYDAKLDLRPLEATLAALDEQHLADTRARTTSIEAPRWIRRCAEVRETSAVNRPRP